MNTIEISTITILHTLSKLNNLELDILGMIAMGKTSAEMACASGVTMQMVETMVNSLLEKFNLDSLSEMVLMLDELDFCKFLEQKIS